MDELKAKIDSYIQLVYSIEELMKDNKERKINLIESKFKSIVKLEIDIIDILESLDSINQNSNETKKRQLSLTKLRYCYNEAHDKYEIMYMMFLDFTISLQFDYLNQNDSQFLKEQSDNEKNDTQTGLLRKFESSIDQFDLERIRKRQNEAQKIEQAIDSSNNIIQTLHRITHEQREKIDHIDNKIDNVCLLKINDQKEVNNRYHDAAKKILPIATAVVAAGVTGPVGLVCGFKIGAAASFALSSIAGFVSGKVIAKVIVNKKNDLYKCE